MNAVSLKEIAQLVRKLDICTFTTVAEGGALLGRPMSNNADVEYDGKSYYFALDSEQVVQDIAKNANVSLGFSGENKLYICVSGKAELIRDKSQFKAHWVPDLDKWFAEGVDTAGLVMIKVAAKNIRYWKGEEAGEWNA